MGYLTLSFNPAQIAINQSAISVESSALTTHISGAKENITYDGTSTTLNLVISDLNDNLLINALTPVIINLPSVTEDNIGVWLRLYKLMVYDITINRADSDTREGGVSVTNVNSDQTWANICLFLATSTEWKIKGAPFGSWSTS